MIERLARPSCTVTQLGDREAMLCVCGLTPSMRRPVGVKTVLFFLSMDPNLIHRAASVAILASAVFAERLSLAARWAVDLAALIGHIRVSLPTRHFRNGAVDCAGTSPALVKATAIMFSTIYTSAGCNALCSTSFVLPVRRYIYSDENTPP
jgi:hypothetical protein